MKRLKLIVSLLIVSSIFAINQTKASAEWIKADSDVGVLWKYSDGDNYAVGWKLIDGNWYYFDEYGIMCSGRNIGEYYVNIDGVWTHLDYSRDNQKFNEFLNRLYEIEKNDLEAGKKASTTAAITLYSSDYAKQYDALLNDIYNYLKEVLPEDKFEKLQNEEIAWVNEKETAIKDDLKRHEGGSMCSYIPSVDTIYYTHDRIYKLLKYID